MTGRHAGRGSWRHDGRPVGVEGVDEFMAGVDEVLSDPALSDEVHYGQEQERLVQCPMVSDLRVPIPAPVGPKICEHLEVSLKHYPFCTPASD